MIKRSFFVIFSLATFGLFSPNSALCQEQKLVVFIGAGCGFSMDALELISKHKALFSEVKIYVLEDSLLASKRIPIDLQESFPFIWTFGAKKHFRAFRIKKVPTFLPIVPQQKKQQKLNTPQMQLFIEHLKWLRKMQQAVSIKNWIGGFLPKSTLKHTMNLEVGFYYPVHFGFAQWPGICILTSPHHPII